MIARQCIRAGARSSAHVIVFTLSAIALEIRGVSKLVKQRVVAVDVDDGGFSHVAGFDRKESTGINFSHMIHEAKTFS